jgi:hypothetical protein
MDQASQINPYIGEGKMRDGGPAFPMLLPQRAENGMVVENKIIPGLTIRDYFAAKAMQSLIIKGPSWVAGDGSEYRSAVARQSYEQADAMITEKNK